MKPAGTRDASIAVWPIYRLIHVIQQRQSFSSNHVMEAASCPATEQHAIHQISINPDSLSSKSGYKYLTPLDKNPGIRLIPTCLETPTTTKRSILSRNMLILCFLKKMKRLSQPTHKGGAAAAEAHSNTVCPSLDAASYLDSTLCFSNPQLLYSRYATCTISQTTDKTKTIQLSSANTKKLTTGLYQLRFVQ